MAMATRPELAHDTGSAAEDWADAVNSITARERLKSNGAKSVIASDLEIQRTHAALRNSTKSCMSALMSGAMVCGYQRCDSCTLNR